MCPTDGDQKKTTGAGASRTAITSAKVDIGGKFTGGPLEVSDTVKPPPRPRPRPKKDEET